jgi:subtilase family serine protease
MDFSGTAAQVRAAFHTEIHNLDVNGERHIANMSDPRISAALSGVVKGVVSLHNFMPRPKLMPKFNVSLSGDATTSVPCSRPASPERTRPSLSSRTPTSRL